MLSAIATAETAAQELTTTRCQRGEAIPIYARIALLAQVVDVFHSSKGARAAIDEARSRRGSWFDPPLVDALVALGPEHALWNALRSPDLPQIVCDAEPAPFSVTVDDDYLDEITAAFGGVVDSKSPYTAGHSGRVAL